MNKKGFEVKGIFLDLDGTIVDSKKAYIEAARIAFQAIGQKPPTKKVALEIPRRLEKGLTISDIVEDDSEKFLSKYFPAYYSVTRKKTKLIPNVAATLEILSSKTKLALITMRYAPKQDVIHELDCFGISKYFTHVVTALDTFKPKPSPEALIACVRALDVEICDCIIAGDSINDVRAGKAAECELWRFYRGFLRAMNLSRNAQI